MSTSPAPAAPRGTHLWPRLILDIAVGVSLCGVLIAVYAFDRGSAPAVAEVPPPPAEPPPLPPPPMPDDLPDEPPLPSPDPTPRVRVAWTSDARFGLVRITGDPDDPNDTEKNKKLTFSPNGTTNNTRIWVDGDTPRFGDTKAGELLRVPARDQQARLSWSWQYKGIEVEQLVELVPGDVSRRMDTIKITYTLHNKDVKPHEVGVRAMIDTLIGANDGVPFFAPGTKDGLIEEPTVFGIGPDFVPGPATGKNAPPFKFAAHPDIPPFIRALERNNLESPGVVVNIGGLRPKTGESPTYVVLCHWPGGEADWAYRWEVPFRLNPRNPQAPADSAVGLYYQPRPLDPGKTRTVTFTYGLGSQTRRKGLTLTAGTAPQAGGEFYLVALIQQPELKMTATIDLPEGMTLVKDARTKPVPETGNYTQVNWRVKVAPEARGTLRAKVRLDSDGKKVDEAPADLTVVPRESRLVLRLPDKLPASQRSFWVAAYVQDPAAGQEVELHISGSGLTLHRDHAARKPVPHPSEQGRYSRVLWLVEADGTARGEAKVKATLHPGESAEEGAIAIEPRKLTE